MAYTIFYLLISNVFSLIGDALGYFNNVIQFLLFISSVIAIFAFFTIPYIKPLNQLLGKHGLQFGEIIRILWICYKRPRILIRLYIELAIINSKGIHHDKHWWKSQTRIFKKFLDENGGSGQYIIEVETCFDLVPADLNDLIQEYFNYFKGKKASGKFAILEDEPVSFLSELRVNEGYLVPLTFITGLNQRYNEDWEKILRNYFIAFNDITSPELAILPEELYFTYTWLMWGPSYQNNYSPQKYRLIQYGFGDESNSVNIVVKNDASGNQLWKKLIESEQEGVRRFGYNCSISGRVIDTSDYYKYKSDYTDNQTVPFLKRLSKVSLGIPFLLELNNFDIKTSAKSENYFFSAYLWIMFELVTPESSGFHPQRTLTFFEHSNIADPVNYDFLAQRLIDKCITHFEYIANHDTYKNRKYQLCLSMNSYINDLFISKLTEYLRTDGSSWFSTNLLIEKPYRVGEILDAFDNYFVNPEKRIDIINVSLQRKETIKQFCNFYAETYLDLLQITPQRLNLDQVLYHFRMRDSGYQINAGIAINSENMVIGSIVFILFPTLNCGVIDNICVLPAYRNNSVGTSLIEHSINQLRINARKLRNAGKVEFVLSCIPVEKSKTNSGKPSQYEKLWMNNGFKKCENTGESLWFAMALDSEKNIEIHENLINDIEKELEHIKSKN